MENQNPDQNENPNLQNQGPVYNQPVQPLYGNPYNMPPRQPMLPGSIAILILGISACVSNVFYFLAGIPAIVCGIIALKMARKANDLYMQNPGMYKKASVSMLRSGRTCGIIGLIIGCCVFLIILVVVAILIVTDGRGF